MLAGSGLLPFQQQNSVARQIAAASLCRGDSLCLSVSPCAAVVAMHASTANRTRATRPRPCYQYRRFRSASCAQAKRRRYVSAGITLACGLRSGCADDRRNNVPSGQRFEREDRNAGRCVQEVHYSSTQLTHQAEESDAIISITLSRSKSYSLLRSGFFRSNHRYPS